MKIVRFKKGDLTGYGQIKGDQVKLIDGNIFENYTVTDREFKLSDIEILAPVQPGKILALGYNYKDLIGERPQYDEPVLFSKLPSCVIGPNETIVIAETDKKVWIEVELAIVIKKHCKDVSVREAKDYILGYTIANDVTTENVLSRDHHLIRSKGFDTFCPLGPHIELDLDTADLKLESKINGEVFQSSTTKNRILNDVEVVSFISNKISLFPGDVIITGTPANAESSLIKKGDQVDLTIEGIGTLSNSVTSK